MAVEILGIQIRQSEEVRGIFLGSSMVKLTQFADDLTAFTTDSQSTKALLKLIEDFGSLSGLKLNRDKSQLLSLGKEMDNPPDLGGLRQVKKVKILGLWFSANRSPMDHYLWNYKDNLDRIRGICLIVNRYR